MLVLALAARGGAGRLRLGVNGNGVDCEGRSERDDDLSMVLSSDVRGKEVLRPGVADDCCWPCQPRQGHVNPTTRSPMRWRPALLISSRRMELWPRSFPQGYVADQLLHPRGSVHLLILPIRGLPQPRHATSHK